MASVRNGGASPGTLLSQESGPLPTSRAAVSQIGSKLCSPARALSSLRTSQTPQEAQNAPPFVKNGPRPYSKLLQRLLSAQLRFFFRSAPVGD